MWWMSNESVKKMRNIGLLFALSLILVACGDDSDSGASATTPSNSAAANGSANQTTSNAAANAVANNGSQNSGAQNNGAQNNGAASNSSQMDAGNNEGMDAGGSDDSGMTSQDMSMPPEFGDPGTAGPYSVETGTTMVTLGNEQVPLTTYLPSGTGPFPVVIFHHGKELAASLYASYGERLASWGYVGIFPDMPGGILAGPTHADLKDLMIELIDWVETDAADGAGVLAGRADSSQLVLAGHSLGGKVSYLTAAEEARVDAIFAVDPVDSAPPGTFDATAYPSATPELMDSITVPMAIVGETVNATCSGFLCQPCAPEDDNFEQYYAAAASPAYVVDVLGADHVSFLDDSNCGTFCNLCGDGSDDPAVTLALTKRIMIAFLESKVRGNAAADAYLTGTESPDPSLATFDSKNGF